MFVDEPTGDGDAEATSMAASVLQPGIATGIGSLPHRDPRGAARLVLRLHGSLPAVPQLPMYSPREGMLAQWLAELPEVAVASDGRLQLDGPVRPGESIELALEGPGQAGLRAFLDVASSAPVLPRRVKVQMTGPLTLGLALVRLGAPAGLAFDRASELVAASAPALLARIRTQLPGADVVMFLDEPSLVEWHTGDPPMHRDDAVDRLSSALARIPALAGVHVCSGGDVRIACESGAAIVGVDVADDVTDFALAMSRHLEGGGWVAWGAVPTHRPIGDSAEPLWRRLVEQWCELTRRGCDPIALRHRAMLTPACGLSGHGLTQAERALRLAAEIGRRVGDQAAATRLTIGA